LEGVIRDFTVPGSQILFRQDPVFTGFGSLKKKKSEEFTIFEEMNVLVGREGLKESFIL
jgi:hypothetical protein